MHSQSSVRLRVAMLIPLGGVAGFGSASMWSVADLIDRLHSDSAGTVASACSMLERMGPDAYPAVETLVGLLDDDRCVPESFSCTPCRFKVRDRALGALAAIGPAARSAVPVLWNRLESTAEPNQTILTAIAQIEGVHVLIPMLSDEDAKARATAASCLVAALSKGAPITLPIEELAGAVRPLLMVPGTEREAAHCIIVEAPATGPFLAPDLVESVAMTAGNRAGKCTVNALVSVGDQIIPMIVPLLDSRRPTVRRTVYAALKKLDPDALDPIGDLPGEAGHAVAMLSGILNADPTTESLYRRIVAARRLTEYGAEGVPAAPGLMMLLVDSDGEAAAAGIMALAALGEPMVDPLLEIAVEVRTLGYRSPLSPEHVDTRTFRQRVLTTLGSIGPAAEKALPEILESSHDHDPGVRATAARAIGALGLDDRQAYLRLVEIVETDRRADANKPALDSIAALAPVIGEATPFLVEFALGDSPIAYRAPSLLAERGADAAPDLLFIMANGNTEIRRSTCGAMSRLDPRPAAINDAAFDLLAETDSRIAQCGRNMVSQLVTSRPDLILDRLLGGDPTTSELITNLIVSRGVRPELKEAARARGEHAEQLVNDLAERHWSRPMMFP